MQVLLPRTERKSPTSSPATAPAPASARRAPGRRTILVVEDDLHGLSLTKTILSEEDYDVLTAQSAADGLAAANAHARPVDLLITDLVMPQVRGDRFADAFLAQYPSAKVLFMSGDSEHHLGEAGAQVPGPLLRKPFSLDELLDKVRSLLDG